MNDLIAIVIAQKRLDFIRAFAQDARQVAAVVIADAARQFAPLAIGHAHHVSAPERAADRCQADRQQAAAAPQGLGCAVIHRQQAGRAPGRENVTFAGLDGIRDRLKTGANPFPGCQTN